ncbi:hypothetical protein Ciccas_013322 [Cichlidogyrus casuarinus]|uniref:Forkhead box P2 n=1 Tax=Cichlidogyrus casuarinus TaxID=1844966 RepID=A0ABD2PMP4_9PLAT
MEEMEDPDDGTSSSGGVLHHHVNLVGEAVSLVQGVTHHSSTAAESNSLMQIDTSTEAGSIQDSITPLHLHNSRTNSNNSSDDEAASQHYSDEQTPNLVHDC